MKILIIFIMALFVTILVWSYYKAEHLPLCHDQVDLKLNEKRLCYQIGE